MLQLMVSVFRLDLPPKEKLLLLALADNADQFGMCYPGMQLLGQKTSMPERTLRRVMSGLQSRGVVTVVRAPMRTRSGELMWRSVYRLCLDGVEAAPQQDYRKCPKWLRAAVIETFAMTCAYCGGVGQADEGPDGRPWQIDRIVPASRGGRYEPSNVTLACANCNSSKGTKETPTSLVNKVGGAIVASHEVAVVAAGGGASSAGGEAGVAGPGGPNRARIEPSETEPSGEPSVLVPAAAVRYLLDYWKERFQAWRVRDGQAADEVASQPPLVVTKDAVLLHRLAKKYGVGGARALIDRMFEASDPWYAKAGFTIAVLHASVNKLLAQGADLRLVSSRAGMVARGLASFVDAEEPPG